MDLDHERLDVYHLALDFLVLASEIIEGLPRGRSHLSDQFARASLSIMLNQTSAGTILRRAARRRSQPPCWTFAVGSSYSKRADTGPAKP
jgi:hypothetical protein